MSLAKPGRLLLILAGGLLFIAGYWLGQSPFAPLRLSRNFAGTPGAAQAAFEPFWEVWDLIHTEYFDQPVDDLALVDGAINGMIEVLDDRFSAYRPPAEQVRFEERLSGEFQGIGAEVTLIDGDITIVSPIEGSPAEAAGLLPGDILRAADGVDLTGMSLQEGVMLVRGPAGTTVTLLIERDGEQLEIDITRAIITTSSVRGELLDDNIAYVRLSQFGDDKTVEDLDRILTELMAAEPQGLILDMRFNPGGLLLTAVDIADQFLPEGPILIERFGNGRERTFNATDDGLAESIPMVVLINEGSASASEVLAGAFRDRNRATLIGQTSFGKGTVQASRQLSNNGGVSITVARWLTPDGTWVHDEGVVPDFFIPQAEDASALDDAQLDAAVDFLLGRPVVSVAPE